MNMVLGTGTLGSSSGNLDNAAVPSDHIRIVKAVTLCNTTATDRWVTILFNGINVLHRYTIPGYGSREENTITIPFFDQVMNATERITGQAEVASAIDYYISGIELDVS